ADRTQPGVSELGHRRGPEDVLVRGLRLSNPSRAEEAVDGDPDRGDGERRGQAGRGQPAVAVPASAPAHPRVESPLRRLEVAPRALQELSVFAHPSSPDVARIAPRALEASIRTLAGEVPSIRAASSEL